MQWRTMEYDDDHASMAAKYPSQAKIRPKQSDVVCRWWLLSLPAMIRGRGKVKYLVTLVKVTEICNSV